jgi:integrase
VAGKELPISIYKYKNGWKAEIWIDRKRITGRSGFETKAAAKKWHDLTVIQFENDPGSLSKTKVPTFDDLLQRFIEIHLPTVAEGTRKRYHLDIDRRIRDHFQFLPLDKITKIDIETFRAGIMTDLSVKSVNMCMDLLRTMLLKAEEWGMIPNSPYTIKPLKQPDRKHAWWDRKEYVVRFLETAKKSRHYAAYKLAIECGLRVGEIVGLSKQDVDLKRCQIHVHRQWIDHQKAFGPTKGRKERFINFDPQSGLKEALAEAILASPDPEVIFTTRAGNRVRSRKLAGRYFTTLLKESRVPKIRFHDLRHTFASWYMIEHDDIWSLRAILGHGDIQTTQRYAHLSRKHQKVPAFSWNVSAQRNEIASTPSGSRNDGREDSSRSGHAPISTATL